VQIELKTLGISPRRAMEQIVDYKNDPGNGYTKTLLCFIQLFIVSNRSDTWYFANNNARHFAFNQDERFLPIYQFADEANKKINHLDSFAETFLVKCTLGTAISRYMVLIQSEQKLKMMRPYQVYDVKAIVADYNARFGTNQTLGEFDLYYQDIQKRIKDQQWPNADFPPAQKIDITTVVDMLLTGFDSKYLNTLYVDKNLKHHGLIQAFSRTNRVLNGTKPYGNILDFRQQQKAVDEAIALFSGEKTGEQAREIWLVDKAPVVIQKLDAAVQKLDAFMKSQGLTCAPESVPNLKGDEARAAFINHFKEVQRLKAQQGKGDDQSSTGADQVDFEFVLFASAVIDYDYIMGLIATFSAKGPVKSKMSREQLIGLIGSDAKFMNERDDIAEYIGTLKAGEGLSETAIRDGYTRFKKEKNAAELAAIADKHHLATAALQTFVDRILDRMIFDGEQFGDLLAPLDLGWKARAQAELALITDLHPLLTKRAQGRDISGLSAYE
jgi:type I restriction enzyme R subunit